MLGGFGGSSKANNINGRFTSLCLTGGVDCNPGFTPDLKVAGGARIKKTLCANTLNVMKNATIMGNLHINGNLTVDNFVSFDVLDANIILGNSLNIIDDALVCGDVHIKGNLLVDGASTTNELNAGIIRGNILNLMSDAIVCGNLEVKGDFFVDSFFMFDGLSANVITGNLLNIMNDALVCGDVHIKGNLLVDGVFGNVVVLDSMANPTYPDFTNTKGVWYGENTFANAFDRTSITLGSDSKTSGSNCISIGSFAGSSTVNGDNVICLGSYAQPSTPTISNEITLGNSAVTTVRSYGAWTFLSDGRDKKDVIPIKAGIDFVSKLKPVDFVWNMRDGGKKNIPDNGFIAQDLKAIQDETGINVPGLVYESNPDKLEISTMKLIPILVKALQECHDEILQLKSRIL